MSTTGTAEAAIKVSNLTKLYSTDARGLTSSFHIRTFLRALQGKRTNLFKALDNVSFDVPAGCVFGLLGPNGAGKTTLIKILSTLVLPDSGTAEVQGFDVVKRPNHVLKHLQAVLSEGFGFERRLTGRQNLEFYADLYGLAKEEARRRIDYLLEYVGLEEKANMGFQRYSTGMARRLLVCRALLKEASVLLFDEPTSGLDPNVAVSFRKLLSEKLSHGSGRTVVVTTHNMWEAQQICDLIAVLDHGKVIATGTTDEIRNMVGEGVNLSVVVSGGSFLNEGSAPALIQQVKRVSGVIKVSLDTNGNSDTRLLSIDGYKDLDFSAIFQLLIKEGGHIVSLEASQPSLEEAFVHLTGKGRK